MNSKLHPGLTANAALSNTQTHLPSSAPNDGLSVVSQISQTVRSGYIRSAVADMQQWQLIFENLLEYVALKLKMK